MRMLFSIVGSMGLALSICACSGSDGGGSSGIPAASNKFTESGSAITIGNIVSETRDLSTQSTSQTFYGRVLYKSGANLYGATVHFGLNKNDSDTAYFSNFYIDRLVQITSYNSATAIVTTPTNTNVTAAHNLSTNSMSISNANSRFVNFNLDFGDNTHFGDVTNAGIIFSSDFSTMVGGNNSTFFFIAQKASSISSALNSDIIASWGLANFTVNGSGTISITSTASVSVSGTGGNGLTAFTGVNNSTEDFQGEATLTDDGTGVFAFGFDTVNNFPPTADGSIDGVFLLSPDKVYILGYSFSGGVYFAASK